MRKIIAIMEYATLAVIVIVLNVMNGKTMPSYAYWAEFYLFMLLTVKNLTYLKR